MKLENMKVFTAKLSEVLFHLQFMQNQTAFTVENICIFAKSDKCALPNIGET